MVRLRVLFIVLGISFAILCSGCSSSGIAITLTSSAGVIQQGETVTISATVTNDSTNSGVKWSLTGPGSLSDITASSVTYHAPSVVSSNTTATVTATSAANSSVTATASITVDAVFEFTNFSLPGGTIGVAYTGSITAGGAATPFTWTMTSGTLPAGLTLATSSDTTSVTISGTPTTAATSTFTMQVANSTGGTISQSFNITISVPPPLIVASGALPPGSVGTPYSATLQADNGTAPYTWSLISGALPAGLSLSASGVISGTPTATGTSDFTVEVTDSSKPTAQTATATIGITINTSTVNNSLLTGSYAFLVNGFDSAGHFTAAGSFTADGAGHITNGLMDSNDPANLVLSQSFTGTYLIGGTDLGTMTFTGTGRTFALSMMADGNARIIEFDNSSAQASGVLLQQNAADLSNPSLSGSYVFGFLGGDPNGNRYAMGGQFAAAAGAITSGILDADAVSGPTSSAAFTGSYNLAATSNGRGTASLVVSGIGTINCSFYLVSDGQLLMMEIDDIAGQNRRVISGPVLQQQSPSLGSATSVLATTSLGSSNLIAQNQIGLFTTDGTSSSTLSADENTGGTLSSPSATGSYSVAGNGRVTLTGSGIASSDPVLYLAGPNQAFVIGTDANVTFGFMELQTGSSFTNSSLSGTYGGASVFPLTSGAINQLDVATADGVANLSFVTDSDNTGAGIDQNAASSGTYSVAGNGRGTITENSSVSEIFYMVSPTEYWSLSTDTNATVEHFQH